MHPRWFPKTLSPGLWLPLMRRETSPGPEKPQANQIFILYYYYYLLLLLLLNLGALLLGLPERVTLHSGHRISFLLPGTACGWRFS